MSIVSLILFVIGLGFLLMGRIKVADIDAEGSPVRVAGFVLMMPLIVVFVFGIIIGALTGGDTDSTRRALNFLYMFEVIGWMVAVAVAYYLIAQKSGVTVDVSNLKIEDLTNINKLRQANPLHKTTAPSVMTLTQAARYLGMSESDLMQAIRDGRISASKTNQGYSIARFVLDEYRDNQANG